MNKKVFKMNLSQIFSSYIFYLSIILVAVVCYISTKQYMGPDIDIVYTIELLISLSMFKKLLLVLASIPFVASFCSEWNDGYIGNVVLRCGVKKYSRAKIWSCTLASFLTMFFGLTLYIVILSFSYPLYNSMINNNTLYSKLLSSSSLVYLYVYVTIFSLAISFWSVLGMVVSVYIPNKFVALSSPIIFSYLIEELTVRFPKFINIYNLSRGDVNFNNSMIISFVYNIGILIFLITLLSFLFRKIVGRRVSNELI